MAKPLKWLGWLGLAAMLVFTGLWFGASWFVQKKIQDVVTRSETAEVSVQTATVTGFPFEFRLQLRQVDVQPKQSDASMQRLKIDDVQAWVHALSPLTLRASVNGVEAETTGKTATNLWRIERVDVSATRGAHVPVVDVGVGPIVVKAKDQPQAAWLTSAGGRITTSNLEGKSSALAPFAQGVVDWGLSTIQLSEEGAQPQNIPKIDLQVQAKGTQPFSMKQLLGKDVRAWAQAGGWVEVSDNSTITLDDAAAINVSGLVGFSPADSNSVLPAGALSIQLKNYPALLASLKAAKILDKLSESQRLLVAPGMSSLSTMLSGSTTDLALPVGFHAGKIWLGPIPR